MMCSRTKKEDGTRIERLYFPLHLPLSHCQGANDLPKARTRLRSVTLTNLHLQQKWLQELEIEMRHGERESCVNAMRLEFHFLAHLSVESRNLSPFPVKSAESS